MARNWTPEERKKHSEAIRRWKPWEQSTGPKTEEGKDMAKDNSLVHGYYGEEMIELRTLLRRQKKFVRGVKSALFGGG